MTDQPHLVPLADAPPVERGGLEVRPAWLGPAAIGWTMAAAAAAGVALPAWHDAPWQGWALGLWFGFWLGLFAMFMLTAAARARRGWALRAGPQRLVINLRSHLNSNFPAEDAVALVLPRRAVRWLRLVEQNGRMVQVRDAGVREQPIRRLYLDVAVDGDTGFVAEALRRERNQRARTKRGSSRFIHNPVLMTPQGLVRVVWRDQNSALRPKLAAARAALARWFRFAEDETEEEAALAALSETELEDRILAMALRGETFEAAKLARVRYGLDLKEAKDLVRGMVEKAP